MRLIGLKAAGGYGKSALVAKLFESVIGFAQVLWTNFNQAQAFGVWIREVVRLLGGPDLEATLTDEQVANYGVQYLSDAPYLVVMDNLETLLEEGSSWKDPAYEQFLVKWLEKGRQTTLLITK